MPERMAINTSTKRGLGDLFSEAKSTFDSIQKGMAGILIYGPVMLIGVQALDLAPKNAAGTSAYSEPNLSSINRDSICIRFDDNDDNPSASEIKNDSPPDNE